MEYAYAAWTHTTVFPRNDAMAFVYFAVHFGAATINSKAALIALDSMNAITQALPSFPLNWGGPSNRCHCLKAGGVAASRRV